MDTLGIVINYYRQPHHPGSVRMCAFLAVQRAVETGLGEPVVLVDGSPEPDPSMEALCDDIGAVYLRGDGELGFAAGYNLGWRSLSNEYVALMASDIFVSGGALAHLMHLVRRPEVGCVSPFLSSADWPSQVASYVRSPITCEPTAMTLNLCVVKRAVLEDVGGIDETFTGAYNDVLLLMNIRNAGYKVLFAGKTSVTHLGKATISHGTNYRKEQDIERFRSEYPQYWLDDGLWHLRNWKRPFSTRWSTSAMWWLAHHMPVRPLKDRALRFAQRSEPRMTSYRVD